MSSEGVKRLRTLFKIFAIIHLMKRVSQFDQCPDKAFAALMDNHRRILAAMRNLHIYPGHTCDRVNLLIIHDSKLSPMDR